jgi:hypothetical protein
MRNTEKVLTGKPEWNKTFGRPRRRWEGNNKMDLNRKIGLGAWIGFMWLVIGTGGDFCDHSNEFSGSLKRGEFLD